MGRMILGQVLGKFSTNDPMYFNQREKAVRYRYEGDAFTMNLNLKSGPLHMKVLFYQDGDSYYQG